MGVCGSDELANVCQHRWLFQVSISIRQICHVFLEKLQKKLRMLGGKQ